jgi:hypothetical protein
MPHDIRIHASTKTTIGDGTWKKKPGGPKGAELEAIEAELMALMVAPVDPAFAAVDDPLAALLAETEGATLAPPVPETWPDFLKAVAALVNDTSNPITMVTVNAAANAAGAASVGLLANKLELLPQVWAAIHAAG